MRRAIRFPFLISSFAIVALCASGAGVGASLWSSHNAALDRRAALDAKTVSKIAVAFGETLRALDVALLAIADETLSEAKPDFDPALRRRARRLLKTIPGLFSSLIVDQDARLRQSFLIEASSKISFRDRAYFTIHERSPSVELYIGPAITSSTYGGKLIPTSLALRAPDGAFAGVVTATMRYDALIERLRDLIEPTQNAYIFTRDGAVVAATDPEVGSAPAEARGVWPDMAGWATGGFAADSLVTIQAVDLADLIVVLKTERVDALDGWRKEFLIGVFLFVVFAALVIAAAVGLYRALSTQQRLAAALAESNAEKTRMFSVLAHDLRGPFGAVTGFASLLVSRAETAPRAEIADFAQQIETTAVALSHTCDSILMWGRGQLGGFNLDIDRVNASKALTNVANGLRVVADGKRVALTIDEPPSTLYASADARALQLVLRNLVENAIKFSRHGGEVILSADPADETGGQMRFVVRDSGAGFPEAKRVAIERGDAVGAAVGAAGERGTGMGLSLSRDLVAAMGGSISIDSVEGEGSTVSVHLAAA